MAAVGDGRTLRLLTGRTGTPLRPQHELGIAADGSGGAPAGSRSAAGARGQHRGADGDEVSGSGGAPQRRGLPADGRGIGAASLRCTAGGATLWRMARRFANGARAHPGTTGAVSEDAAAADAVAGSDAGCRADKGTGDCIGDSAAGRPPGEGSRSGDECGTAAAGAAPDRRSAPGAGLHRGTDHQRRRRRRC
jgi:hypothetical protein